MSPATQAKLGALYESHYDDNRTWAEGYLRDPELAEDVTMQAFTKLGESMERGNVRQPERLLTRIQQGLLIDTVREKDRHPVVSFEEHLSDQDSLGAESFLSIEDAPFPGDFDQAVRDLPEEERAAFILTELRGLTVREAADVLGTSKSDVDRRVSSARTSIRKELAA